MSAGDVRLEASVKGRVQGVGFRYHVSMQARQLELTGYVRNLWDGSVEVVAEGPKVRVDRLLSYLQAGPRPAWVRDVVVTWLPATGEFLTFEVRH